MKPPARDIAIDALEDLWRNCKPSDTSRSIPSANVYLSDDDAKAPTAKHLAKWRPQVLASEGKLNPVPALNNQQQAEDSKPAPSSAPSAPSKHSPAIKNESEQMKNNQAGQAVAAAG